MRKSAEVDAVQVAVHRHTQLPGRHGVASSLKICQLWVRSRPSPRRRGLPVRGEVQVVRVVHVDRLADVAGGRVDRVRLLPTSLLTHSVRRSRRRHDAAVAAAHRDGPDHLDTSFGLIGHRDGVGLGVVARRSSVEAADHRGTARRGVSTAWTSPLVDQGRACRSARVRGQPPAAGTLATSARGKRRPGRRAAATASGDCGCCQVSRDLAAADGGGGERSGGGGAGRGIEVTAHQASGSSRS